MTVDWADPINSPASEIMDKVKVLYVKNLASSVTEESLVTTFSAYGEVEKAKKLKGSFCPLYQLYEPRFYHFKVPKDFILVF